MSIYIIINLTLFTNKSTDGIILKYRYGAPGRLIVFKRHYLTNLYQAEEELNAIKKQIGTLFLSGQNRQTWLVNESGLFSSNA